MKRISLEAANELMTFAAWMYTRITGADENNIDEITAFTRSTFVQYCKAVGIEEVEDPDEDEDEDASEEDMLFGFNFDDDDDDDEYYELTPKGTFYLRLRNNKIDDDEARRIANIIFDDDDEEVGE